MIYRGPGFIVVPNVEFFLIGLRAIFQVRYRYLYVKSREY
jgi:hypothetical protein